MEREFVFPFSSGEESGRDFFPTQKGILSLPEERNFFTSSNIILFTMLQRYEGINFSVKLKSHYIFIEDCSLLYLTNSEYCSKLDFCEKENFFRVKYLKKKGFFAK